MAANYRPVSGHTSTDKLLKKQALLIMRHKKTIPTPHK